MQVHVGLALSGGGFRAAAFHLGTLKRLEELGILEKVETMSCVSGGSITGGLLALRCIESGNRTPGGYPVDRLIDEMVPVLTRNLRASALFGTPLRALQFTLSWVSRRVSRVGLIGRELDRQLFKGATLDRLPDWILINATNLRTGKAWKFYRDRAGDYLVGATDKTSGIRVTDAISASAAYPGLTDAFAFRTRWEEMREDLLDEERWQRPPQNAAGAFSRWRQRYGGTNGTVMFPLVDGGLYDNDGANGLRGRRVTHAILSGVSPPEDDEGAGFGPRRLLRLVTVIHDRLGAATRQLVHEMTHGVHPGDAAKDLGLVETDLRALASAPGTPDTTSRGLLSIAERVGRSAKVGLPLRGHQYTASAQILLHRSELATNSFAFPAHGGIDVPVEYRGLAADLVSEISRTRTDFDALEPEVVELLMAQAYYLTDLFLKASMPELLPAVAPQLDWYESRLAPSWDRAAAGVTHANANRADATIQLKAAQERRLWLGRVPSRRAQIWYGSLSLLVPAVVAIVVVGLGAGIAAQVFRFFGWLLR